MEKKGTVTSLSSLFPAEEAQKASKRVQDTIAERQQQLHQLNSFITDNDNIINLVHRLPDELHHDIMVPFGKAAFFPGRLIHTNEFMVLLGEGYYADRTSKQTVEILKRRGKQLDSQVESLKAVMQDLKAEASFFDATATEASEGLVEIREDYVEENYSGPLAKTGSKSADSIGIEVGEQKTASEDEEYARIFARMAELEKEEEEEEEEEEEAEAEEEAEQSSETDEVEPIQNQLNSSINQVSVTQEVKHSQVDASEVRPIAKDISPHGNYPTPKSIVGNKPFELSKVKEVQSPPADSNTAFTGSIVEHAYGLGINSAEQRPGAGSSKPVSRFKMQRK